MNRNRLLFVPTVAVLVAGVSAAAIVRPTENTKCGPFDVALIGDIPYNTLQEQQTA